MTASFAFCSFRRLAHPSGQGAADPHAAIPLRGTTGPAFTATPVCNGSGANHLKLT